jgi:molybdate transport system regulatory protein
MDQEMEMRQPPSKPLPHRRGKGLGSSPTYHGCRLTGRLWVEKDGETFLAWGRVVLLERIREHGSITAAARSMGMGYRHAWMLIDEMNRLSPRPLVVRAVGGRGGGGSRLTPAGEAVVAGFWALVEDFTRWLAAEDPRLWERKKRRGPGTRGAGRSVPGSRKPRKGGSGTRRTGA